MSKTTFGARTEKVRLLLKLERLLWGARLPLRYKCLYAATRFLGLATGSVRWGTTNLTSDNRRGLLLLPDYLGLVGDVLRVLADGQVGAGLRVLDIGANVGQFTRTLVMMRPDARVLAVEANPQTFNILSENLRGYPSAVCANVAVGAAEGTLRLFWVAGKSAQASVHKENAQWHLGTEATEFVDLPVKSAASVADEFCSDLDFDLIKIDVEGYELEVIAGLVGISTRHVLLEVSPGRYPHTSEAALVAALSGVLGCQMQRVWTNRSEEASEVYDALFTCVGK